MTNLINRKMFTEYEKRFASLEGAIFVKYEKHAPAPDRELRKALRKENVQFRVVKNRIARRALTSCMSPEAANMVKGPTALAYGNVETVIAAAKVFETARKNKSTPGIEVRGGYLQGQILTTDQIKQLSGLPSKKEMLSMILGAITGTAANVPSLAFSALVTPARLVAALIEKREKEAEGSTPAAS
ncbi:MAG: 50S ribosomal protein L10 [Planctomycetes bacterium]|nr:50S ribosomal protein L10 [Planctomycetota bacterium]